MKLLLKSKLNFRDTHDSLSILASNSEFVIEHVLRNLFPEKRITNQCFGTSVDSNVNWFPCYEVDDDIDKRKYEYEVDGTIGILKIDLPKMDVTSSDVTKLMRNTIEEHRLGYIDFRID